MSGLSNISFLDPTPQIDNVFTQYPEVLNYSPRKFTINNQTLKIFSNVPRCTFVKDLPNSIISKKKIVNEYFEIFKFNINLNLNQYKEIYFDIFSLKISLISKQNMINLDYNKKVIDEIINRILKTNNHLFHFQELNFIIPTLEFKHDSFLNDAVVDYRSKPNYSTNSISEILNPHTILLNISLKTTTNKIYSFSSEVFFFSDQHFGKTRPIGKRLTNVELKPLFINYLMNNTVNLEISDFHSDLQQVPKISDFDSDSQKVPNLSLKRPCEDPKIIYNKKQKIDSNTAREIRNDKSLLLQNSSFMCRYGPSQIKLTLDSQCLKISSVARYCCVKNLQNAVIINQSNKSADFEIPKMSIELDLENYVNEYFVLPSFQLSLITRKNKIALAYNQEITARSIQKINSQILHPQKLNINIPSTKFTNNHFLNDIIIDYRSKFNNTDESISELLDPHKISLTISLVTLTNKFYLFSSEVFCFSDQLLSNSRPLGKILNNIETKPLFINHLNNNTVNLEISNCLLDEQKKVKTKMQKLNLTKMVDDEIPLFQYSPTKVAPISQDPSVPNDDQNNSGVDLSFIEEFLNSI